MQSAFSGIEIGKRSLFAHQIGIHTIGHNLSNIETEGYSRQRVTLASQDPIYHNGLNRPDFVGQIGQGVTPERISRVRDNLLEKRIITETSSYTFWDTRDRYLLSLERIYNEPTELSVRTTLDRFWSAWQELANHPNENAARHAVLESGDEVVSAVRDQYLQLEQLRSTLDTDIRVSVGNINTLLNDITEISTQISKVRAAGDLPNDLLDRRDAKVEQLSGYIAVTTSDRDTDDFSVYSEGLHLVQGTITRALTTIADPLNDSFGKVVWAHNNEDFVNSSGKLTALLALRNEDVSDAIDSLDSFTINFIDLVNENHRAGIGLNNDTNLNFFIEVPRVINTVGNFDLDGDGAFDSTYLFRVSGTNRLNPQALIGFSGSITLPTADGTVNIDYRETDTVEQLLLRINRSNTEVVARLDRDGVLQLKATAAANPENPAFVIRSFADSGQFLVGYAGILQATGDAGAYNWAQADAVDALQTDSFAVAPLLHPAGWLAVNPQLQNNILSIASAARDVFSNDAATGSNEIAVAIAQLRNTPVLIGQQGTIDDYFSEVIGVAGIISQRADIAKLTHADILKSLTDIRHSISGVNIDEEVAELIKYQHAYSAAARFVSNVDTMLDTIINRMGV